MANRIPTTEPDATTSDLEPVLDGDGLGATAEAFRAGFGEELARTLDLDTWRCGVDLAEEYARIETEVRVAVERETAWQRRIRDEVFPRLPWGEGAPPGAGYEQVEPEEIEAVHRGLLFRGAVEACDGTNTVHDTLPLTIHQIGVGLVSYAGNQGTWHQRLFRRDLRQTNADPVNEVLELLEQRGRRSGLNHAGSGDPFSELFQRAVMAYAERAILMDRSQALWRMGHGNPAPHELLTGAGIPELMIAGTQKVRDLVEGHKRFVFVASEPAERMLLTIGQALRPLEYAVVTTLRDRITPDVERVSFGRTSGSDLRWDGERVTHAQWLIRFRDTVAAQVVVGVYRATILSPAQVFYAHVDHADVAARIALADSVLQQQRGFPLLIDLADHICRSVYGGGSLNEMVATAYAAAEAPWRYLSERATRR